MVFVPPMGEYKKKCSMINEKKEKAG